MAITIKEPNAATLGRAITCILLQAIPDASASGSVGRGNAGFIITEGEVSQESDSGGQTPLSLVEAAADFERSHSRRIYDARFAIDGNNGSQGWCVTPQVNIPHRLVLKVGQPGGVTASALTFVIRHNHFDPNHHKSGSLLGRFRLSVSEDAHAFETTKARFLQSETRSRKGRPRNCASS